MLTAMAARKPFYVDAVQVTEENLKEAATWCGGTIVNRNGKSSYIVVPVNRPQTPRQTKAFVGDWILKAPNDGFKCYTEKAFQNTFEIMVENDRFVKVTE